MRKIKIVHVVYGLGTGGTELVLRKLISGLDPDLFENVICVRSNQYRDATVPGARVVTAECGSAVISSPLLRVFRQERPEVVHSRNWGGVEAVIAARIAGVRHIVHSEHGRDISTMAGDLFRRRLFRHVCYRAAHTVFTVSQELRDHYARQAWFPKARMSVLPNGIDTVRFHPDRLAGEVVRAKLGIDAGTLVVGMVARFDPVKDHGALLLAAAQCLRDGMKFRVVLVGDGPEQARVRQQAASDARLRDAVVFAGEVGNVQDWFNAFDVFVLPSLSEGMPNTLLEAMACGLPAIATAVGGSPEVLGDEGAGVLVPPRDADAMARHLTLLAGDEQRRHVMGMLARRRVRSTFGFEQMIRRYTELYRHPISVSRTDAQAEESRTVEIECQLPGSR